MLEPLDPEDIDCATVHDAVQKGHHGCLAHLASISPDRKLAADANGGFTVELLQHQSDQSCTAMLKELLRDCTQAQMHKLEQALYNKGKSSWLIDTCIPNSQEVKICYSCLHAVLDAGAGADYDDCNWGELVLYQLFGSDK